VEITGNVFFIPRQRVLYVCIEQPLKGIVVRFSLTFFDENLSRRLPRCLALAELKTQATGNLVRCGDGPQRRKQTQRG
jgi:hypothetical protein